MEYIAHHGILGQKWGVRRYQNSDGSLTDEGRRRYGYGIRQASKTITQNTKERLKQGAKLGAKIGVGVGGISGLVGGTVSTAALMSGSFAVAPAVAIPLGAAYLASTTVAGALGGTVYGAGAGGIAGAIETKKGREYIERYDKGLKAFEKREEAAYRREKNK